jgi:hypothetical protein
MLLICKNGDRLTEKREGTDIGWVHGRAGVRRAGEDEADSGEGEHPGLEDGVAGALDDDPEHGHGDDEGEHPFGDGAGVGIDLERGPPEHVLVLRRHELRDGQSAAHSAGGLISSSSLLQSLSGTTEFQRLHQVRTWAGKRSAMEKRDGLVRPAA